MFMLQMDKYKIMAYVEGSESMNNLEKCLGLKILRDLSNKMLTISPTWYSETWPCLLKLVDITETFTTVKSSL